MPEKAPQDTESRHADKYIVRFPDGMRDRLKAEAAKNNRTLNAEIVLRLQESLDSDGHGARATPGDLSAFLAQMRAEQTITAARTRLQLAQMRAENATTATRGLKLEIREMKEALAAVERLELNTQDVEELRGRLRLAEHVLPQHEEIIRAATEEAHALQEQLATFGASTQDTK